MVPELAVFWIKVPSLSWFYELPMVPVDNLCAINTSTKKRKK